jgi:predicted CXXCH cytochrome family protein
LLASLSLAALAPVSAAAQHPQIAETEGAAELSSCDYCHAAHVGRPTRVTLRLGGGMPGELEAWQSAQAPGTTAITASCVRCHLNESVRRRQSDLPALTAVRQSEGARYLGPVAAGLHPLGDVEVSVPQPAGRRSASRRYLESPLQLETQSAVIECTDCHDPHDRRSPIPDAGEQRLICAGCHNPSEYAAHDHVSLACSDCHDLHHGQPGTRLLRESTPDLQCQSCHSASALPSVSATGRRRRLSPAAAAAAAPAHGPTGRCTECHTSHGGGALRPEPR